MSESSSQTRSSESKRRDEPREEPACPQASTAGGWLQRLTNEERVRPSGFSRPTSERAIRALKALEDDRLVDAEAHITALSESPPGEHAWKCRLGGLLAVARGDSAAAVALFLQAASSALVQAYGREDGCDADAFRLCASALEKVGELYRRQDRADDATQMHMAALRLRSEHGSFAELWESAVSLGLDADLGRRLTDAAKWHRTAIDLGSRANEGAARKKAIASTHLSKTLMSDGRYEEGVAVARGARELWREHDVGAVWAARADLNLGHALLEFGGSLHDRDAARAGTILNEALGWLTGALKELHAFGSEYTADADWCGEQIDFAKRLLDSLDA